MSYKKSDYRVILTKRMFRQALTALLLEKPLQSITVKELCEAAGVNRGTFYSHYTDIYALMNAIEAEIFEELKNTLALLSETDKKKETGSPFSIYLSLFEFFIKNSDMCTILLGQNSDRRFVNQLLDLGLEACVKVYRPKYPKATDTEIELFYNFIANGCIGLLQYWINGRMMPADEIAFVMESIISDGEKFLGR